MINAKGILSDYEEIVQSTEMTTDQKLLATMRLVLILLTNIRTNTRGPENVIQAQKKDA